MLFIQVLRHLIAVNISFNHKEVLIKTMKNAEKQATIQERLNFLIQCRRNNLTPNFIKNSLSAAEKIFTHSRSFEKRRDNFCRNLLNEAIQATHRTRAFLKRESTRLANERYRSYRCSLTKWVEHQSVLIFMETASKNHRRLVDKFINLKNSKKRLQEQHQQKRLKNLSSVQPSNELARLLDKGPKFALTQTISKKTLRDVEIGVEKMINTIRWKEFWSQHPTSAPAVRPFSFLPTRSHQAPKADPVTEQELSQMKKKVISIYKNHKNVISNHSGEQRKELKNFKNNENIIIKPSDKCKGLVIMDKSDYIAKADSIITNYEQVTRNPTKKNGGHYETNYSKNTRRQT